MTPDQTTLYAVDDYYGSEPKLRQSPITKITEHRVLTADRAVGSKKTHDRGTACYTAADAWRAYLKQVDRQLQRMRDGVTLNEKRAALANVALTALAAEATP